MLHQISTPCTLRCSCGCASCRCQIWTASPAAALSHVAGFLTLRRGLVPRLASGTLAHHKVIDQVTDKVLMRRLML